MHYRARATDEGKKLTALDGFRVLGTLLRCRFSGGRPSVEGQVLTQHARTALGGAAGRSTASGCAGTALYAVPVVAVACVVLAAISAAVLPTVPSYDPWAWIFWGREVTDPHLSFVDQRRSVVEAAAGDVHDDLRAVREPRRRRCG